MELPEFEKFKANFYEIHKEIKELAIEHQNTPTGKKIMKSLDKLEKWFLDFIEMYKPK